MTVLQVAREHYSNRIQSSFAFYLLKKKFCLLLVGEGFFLHYYTNTIHILHMRFYIVKMSFIIGDTLIPTRPIKLGSRINIVDSECDLTTTLHVCRSKSFNDDT
jgi:hypothetical protein